MRSTFFTAAFACSVLLAHLPAAGAGAGAGAGGSGGHAGASAGAGKIASRSSPSRVLGVAIGLSILGSGSNAARLRRDEVVVPEEPDLPPPPLVDAQGIARYVDGDTRTFEINLPGRRMPVRWTRSTAFVGTGPGSLEGRPVRVQGQMAEGVLHATAIEPL